MKWQPAWIRGGKIKDVVWVDRNVIAWYSGIHITFFHLINEQEIFFSCSPSADGIGCIAGHSALHLFAFAEMTKHPRILVYSYPKMICVSECRRGSQNSYLATSFASSEYLVSLGSYPTYSITIWNWKTGNELHSISTFIHDHHGQMIRVSQSEPILIAHLGRDSGKLLVWTVVITSTIVISYERIILPHEATAFYVDWSSHRSDPQLVIVDENGHVYISNKDGSEINRIIFSQRCGVCLEYEIPIVCWFQDGIMLKTTFCQIRYYKKNKENKWRRERHIESKLKPYIIIPNPFNKDQLFYFTEEGFLMQMNLSDTGVDTLKVDKKLYHGGIYSFIDFIYPWAHDLVVVDTNFDLNIVDATNGKFISTLNMGIEGKVTHLVSHPDYPLVAFVTTSGELFIITVNERDNPSVLLKYRLQSEQLDILKFSQCGKHLIVGGKISGICYCIISTLKNQFSRIYQLNVGRQIVDIVFYDEIEILKVIVLILSSTIAFASNYMLMYVLLPNEENFIQSEIITRLPAFYQSIHYTPQNSKVLIASPYLSRQIHFFNRPSGMKINLFKIVETSHQVRALKIYTNRQYLTTCAIDGVINVVTGQTQTETRTILSTHHRKDLGVVRAICSPSGSLIIALGHNGSVVCVKLKLNGEHYIADEIDSQKFIKSNYINFDKSILEYLSGPCQIIPSVMDTVKTWVEWKNEQIFLKEEKEYREKKNCIKKKFNEIRNKIKRMLDENEGCQDIEKLPVATFDLAIFLRKQKIKSAKEEREDIRLKLEFECASMKRVTDWIKANFWDPQSVVPQSIFSFFSDYAITNYPSVPEDLQEKEFFVWNKYFVDSNMRVKHIYPELKRCLLIKHRYKPSRTDEKSVIESLLIDDEVYEDEKKKKEEQQMCEGVNTFKFIQPSSQYSQYEDYNFQQFISMTKDIINDIHQLKNYFNKLFEKMYEVKTHQVELFHERNEKIYHIDSELKLLFNQSVPEIIPDPKWHFQEHPESIINILDDEVKTKPYVSPSQLELEKNQVEKAERMRLLLMANDFREKMLVAMMDGVLEFRWEDILKKDIHKPQCMFIKSPDDYNIEDILTVEKYENDVQILIQEREKYRRILEANYLKIMKILQEDVHKFDLSLREFALVKIKVETAIQQLNLMRTRRYLRDFHQMIRLEDIIKYREKITDNKQRIEKILDENHILQALLSDLKNQRELLLVKEKTILKKLKMEFRSLKKITFELLKKQYRKRPKVTMKHTTFSEFLELGKCLITDSDPKFLNHYCMEYLAGVKTLDIQPSNLIELIKPHHWHHLVKIRRNKMEIEMNLKANWKESNEIDRSIVDNNKKIEKLKRDIFGFEDHLNQINEDQQKFDINIEIQLVLTMGQMEIIQIGHKEEMENAVLLPRQEIMKINNKVLRVADEKLKTVKRAIKFGRGRIFKEWQHKCLKMTIANLQDDLREIKSFSVTKDIRIFLKRRAMGLKEDKTVQQLERQIQAVKMSLYKSLKQSVMMLEGIETKIEITKRDNYALDKKITDMNVDRWELELERDLEAEDRYKRLNDRKMVLAFRRSKLIIKIQEEYTEYLTLKSEFEFLRSKKYPVISSVKILSDECIEWKK